MLNDAGAVAQALRRGSALIDTVTSLARMLKQEEIAQGLSDWSGSLKDRAGKLSTVEGIVEQKALFGSDFQLISTAVEKSLGSLREVVNAKPDQSSAVQAQTFLTRAQDRFSAYRKAREAKVVARDGELVAKAAADLYSHTAEESLSAMYVALRVELGSVT